MRKVIFFISLILVSCSSDDGKFSLKGKFKNFNQGELYVYSLLGMGKIDTIKLFDGKFTYEREVEDTTLLSIVFPNFSEIPVIASSGTSATMEGDASHLREVKVTGTDDNKLLTQFRLRVNELTPPEQQRAASQFITDNPASPACIYVLNRFYALKADADYRKINGLMEKMANASPENQRLTRLNAQFKVLKGSRKGDKLPKFSATTTTGRNVSNADLNGELNVVSLWASWNYESQTAQRQLRKLKKQYGSRLQLLSINIDGNPAECKKIVTRDSLSWPLVCDGHMWVTPIVGQLGFCSIPDLVLTDRDGSVIMRTTVYGDVTKEIEQRLGK